MKHATPLLVGLLMLTIPMAGCVDKLSGYEPYDIEIIFVDWQPTESEERAIREAAELWQENIVEGIDPMFLTHSQEDVDSSDLYYGCQPINQQVDDLLLWIMLDDNMSSLANSKVCSADTHDGIRHAKTGSIRFDPDTLTERNESEIRDITAHEIGHTLLFSPRFWNIDFDGDEVLDREFVPGYDGVCEEGDAPRYYGPEGMAAWHSVGGSGGVPLQRYLAGQNGAWSGCVHLDDDVFPEEINAAYLGGEEVFGLSNITLGMLEDQGYLVDYNNAIETEVDLSAVLAATN